MQKSEVGDREISEQYVAVIQVIWSRTGAMVARMETQHR